MGFQLYPATSRDQVDYVSLAQDIKANQPTYRMFKKRSDLRTDGDSGTVFKHNDIEESTHTQRRCTEFSFSRRKHCRFFERTVLLVVTLTTFVTWRGFFRGDGTQGMF